MTRPRPPSWPVAKPGVDPGLDGLTGSTGPDCRGEVSLSVGRRAWGLWWRHPGLLGLELGVGESPLCGGDTASLGARGRPWILRVTSRGHWLCLCSGHLPAPTPGVCPHLSVSPSVPALQPLPKNFHPHSPSHVLSHVCPPRHQAPPGVLVPSLQAQQGPRHEGGSSLLLGRQRVRKLCPITSELCPPPWGLPSTLRAAPLRERQQTRTPSWLRVQERLAFLPAAG